MQIQLRQGTTDRYLFITDCAKPAKGPRTRGDFAFEFEEVEFVRFEADNPESDGENRPIRKWKMPLAAFAAWWRNERAGWKIVDV